MEEINESSCDCPCLIVDPVVTHTKFKELSGIWPSGEDFRAAVANANANRGKVKMNGGRRTRRRTRRRMKGGGNSLIKAVLANERNRERTIQVLQRATNERFLGSGSLGQVYLVRFPNGTFGVKKSMRYPINDCDMDQMVGREIATMVALTNNPATQPYVTNILGALYYNEEPSTISKLFCCKKAVYKTVEIFMTYVQGDTLQNIYNNIGDRRRYPVLSIDFMTAVIPKLYTAINQLHAAGYVHCDIKPANIFISEDEWDPILIDFGGTIPIGRPFEYGTIDYLPQEYAASHFYHGRAKPPAIPMIDLYGLDKTVYGGLAILRSFVLGQGRYIHPDDKYIPTDFTTAIEHRFPGRVLAPPDYVWRNVVLEPSVGASVRSFNAAAGAGAAAGGAAAGAGGGGENYQPIPRTSGARKRK